MNFLVYKQHHQTILVSKNGPARARAVVDFGVACDGRRFRRHRRQIHDLQRHAFGRIRQRSDRCGILSPPITPSRAIKECSDINSSC